MDEEGTAAPERAQGSNVGSGYAVIGIGALGGDSDVLSLGLAATKGEWAKGDDDEDAAAAAGIVPAPPTM